MLLSQFKNSEVLCTFKLKGWNRQYDCMYSLTKYRLKVKTNYKTWVFINVKEEYIYNRKYIEKISAVLNFKVSCRHILWKFRTVIKMFRPLK
jgi:hypothetical protein